MRNKNLIKASFLLILSIILGIFSFQVSDSYEYDGRHWPDADATSLPIYVNTSYVPSHIDFPGCVQAAIKVWNDVDSSYFNFIYNGTTTEYNWDTQDGVNSYIWTDGSGMDSTELATNKTWSTVSTKEILESDVRVNGSKDWSWDSAAPDRMAYDLQHVMTHESGHSLWLGDIYDSYASSYMMYGYYHSSRILAQDDIDGITHIYTAGSTPTSSPTPTPTATNTGGASGGGGGGGCFIATAAYGSYIHKDVMVLRSFRDNVLLASAPGTALVDFYYRTSPSVAVVIASNNFLRTITRLGLTPLVYGFKYPYFSAGILLLSVMGAFYLIRRNNRKNPVKVRSTKLK